MDTEAHFPLFDRVLRERRPRSMPKVQEARKYHVIQPSTLVLMGKEPPWPSIPQFRSKQSNAPAGSCEVEPFQRWADHVYPSRAIRRRWYSHSRAFCIACLLLPSTRNPAQYLLLCETYVRVHVIPQLGHPCITLTNEYTWNLIPAHVANPRRNTPWVASERIEPEGRTRVDAP